ncbi:MAG: type 4a pilus biogenesis protein PilO, partial [Thermodesulfovibrionia bacterium]|nr:type 4a pilus biogenesis protein PilO [Thermodesulfovibrionia bacterium]
PVKVEVRGNYHNLGSFFSRVSQLQRIVNLSNIELDYNTPTKKIMVRFNAATFSAVTK